MTDYDKQYQESADVCGLPFPEIEAFLRGLEIENAEVLDLGCGQGRDALLAARLGHRVVGIDIAPSGIDQMLQVAKEENLPIHGLVADILDYEPSKEFDVVLLDRVLHMMDTHETREAILRKVVNYVRAGGYILIADTPSNAATIAEFFGQLPTWDVVEETRNFYFTKKVSD